MKRSVVAKYLSVSSIYLLTGFPVVATAQTAIPLSGTTTSSANVPSSGRSIASPKLVSSFEAFAGSEENSTNLVSGLRTGSPITLTTVRSATAGGLVTESTSFVPPTRPMGWGNVRHALTLAQRELAAQGITQPTPSQLQAALMGGAVTTSSGRIVALQGTLALRSQGMGWGRIAHTLGVSTGNAASMHAGSDHQRVALHQSTHDSRVVSASGHRVGAVTNAGGEVVRSSHWSGAGSSHARVDGGAAVSARSGGVQALPVASTPTAAGFGMSVAANHGGLGNGGGRGNGR